MSLQYIIDGYNIIHHPQFSRLHKQEADSRRALLELIRIKRLCGSRKNKITVVFDGYSDVAQLKQHAADIQVIFSGSQTADDKIKRIFEAADNSKNTIVVSDDRQIILFIRSSGGKVLSVEEFISPKEKVPDKEKESSKPELNYSQMQKINEELKKIWLHNP